MNLPFEHLNLCFNPFGELDEFERSDVAVVVDLDLDAVVERLRIPGHAVQFIGNQGRGKTTHLLALRRFFPDAPYVHVGDMEPIPYIPKENLLFLDESQRIPRRSRREIFHRCASFVIGSHCDHTRELQPPSPSRDGQTGATAKPSPSTPNHMGWTSLKS